MKKIMEESKKSVKEVYSNKDMVNYRNIIMCPSHLVEKWAESIREEIPYARVAIIRGLKELTRLRKRGPKRTGKEFYILSKETGKLSYSYFPLPSQIKIRNVTGVVCRHCEIQRPESITKQCTCGSQEWILKDYGFQAEGMICPECGQLLYPADVEVFSPDPEKMPLQPFDFASQTKANRNCRHCGTQLWQPACEPQNNAFLFHPVKKRKMKWLKMTHYSNKAKKNTKTVWVYDKWKEEYISENELSENEISYPRVYGSRKFAPSRFIKKYLKGFF